MSKPLFNFLKVLISVGLAAILLYLVFKNVEWAEFWEKAKSVDYTWVYVSIVLSVVAYFARAYRWNILLEPLGYELKTSRTALAVIIGYLANLALPRLGEITRCGVLKRNEQVPLPVSFGSVVTERLIDVITLLFLMLVSLLVESERLLKFLETAYKDLNIPSWVIWIVLAAGVIGIGLLVLFIKSQDKLKGKLAEFAKEFVAGLLSLRKIKNPLGFFVSTFVLWLVYFLMSYIISILSSRNCSFRDRSWVDVAYHRRHCTFHSCSKWIWNLPWHDCRYACIIRD